jgi:hypothetical protein
MHIMRAVDESTTIALTHLNTTIAEHRYPEAPSCFIHWNLSLSAPPRIGACNTLLYSEKGRNRSKHPRKAARSFEPCPTLHRKVN